MKKKKGKKKKNVSSSKKQRKSRSDSNSGNKQKKTSRKSSNSNKGKKATKKSTSSSTGRIKEKRYGYFSLKFTALRQYDYNRPSELEIFTRTIPVLHPVTLQGFIDKYLEWLKDEEIKTFDKIEADTEGSVSWSNWIVEVAPMLDEDEIDEESEHVKIKSKKRKKKKDEDNEDEE